MDVEGVDMDSWVFEKNVFPSDLTLVVPMSVK